MPERRDEAERTGRRPRPAAAAVARALLFASGCAATAPRAEEPADLDGAIETWIGAEDASPPSSTLASRRDPRARSAPARDARAARAPIPRGRPIDVRLSGAPLASALALLAEAAGLGLVVGEGVEGTVSVDLRNVRPLDAMRAIAEAHGVELTFVGRTVIARRAGS